MIKNNDLPQFNLTDEQVTDLARPLVGIISEYFKDPKNEESFQAWLQQQIIKSTDSIK